MKDLTITQEYMICAVNENGKISGFSTEKQVCFVAAGLLEMQLENCIKINKKNVIVTAELPADKMHLKPLYDFINQSKPVKLEKVAEAYNCSLTDKRLSEFMDAVGTSLESMGFVKISQTGLFGNKQSYIPTKEAINYVIDLIRSELLEDGTVTADIASLMILLDKSKVIKTYFSSFEQKEIKTKLKQITNSETGKIVKDMVDYVEGMIVIMSSIVLFCN